MYALLLSCKVIPPYLHNHQSTVQPTTIYSIPPILYVIHLPPFLHLTMAKMSTLVQPFWPIFAIDTEIVFSINYISKN